MMCNGSASVSCSENDLYLEIFVQQSGDNSFPAVTQYRLENF